MPLAVGFWGASGTLLVVGPELAALYGKSGLSMAEPYKASIYFDAVRNADASLKNAGFDVKRRGYLRMVPSLWYGVRPEVADRYVPDGRSSSSGRFFRIAPRRPSAPKGWRIVSMRMGRVPLPLDFPNPAHTGGGIGVTLREPNGWKLADIGLTSEERYVVGFGPAWDSPFSVWKGKKPPRSESPRYSMDPVVLAGVIDVTYENLETGERRVEEIPSGWVEAAGKFFLIDGSSQK